MFSGGLVQPKPPTQDIARSRSHLYIKRFQRSHDVGRTQGVLAGDPPFLNGKKVVSCELDFF